MNAVVTIDSGH